MTAIEEPEGSGVSRIKDERVRFYLDNFKLIETWAQIRADANQELHDVFLDMSDALTAEATDRGYDDIVVRVDEQTNPRKPRILITRRAWHAANGEAPAATAIEWHQPPIDKSGDLYLYVGVRVGDRRRRDLRVAERLSSLAPTLRRKLGSDWQKEDENFPIWRWIEPEGDALDETVLVNQARRAAWTCWEATTHYIDNLLAER